MSITYEEAKTLFISGISLSEIAKKYHYNRHRLSKELKNDNIAIKINNQRYEYRDDYFSIIDTEDKAYWLGFLYADGYVSEKNGTVEITLQEGDVEHLNKLKNQLCPLNPITLRQVKLKDKLFNSYRLTICNKQITNDLVSQGCVQKKSLVLQFPKLPIELERHFIRGYFDGDGSVGKYSNKLYLSLCSGSESFLAHIHSIFNRDIPKYTITAVKKDIRSNVYNIQKGGNPSVFAILDYLYSNSSIYLIRKYAFFEALPSKEETL